MKNILIIEDERTVAELERDYLEINSLKVSIEETGDGGLKRILKNDIDLVILDLMLPDMDGFEVCRKIRFYTLSVNDKLGIFFFQHLPAYKLIFCAFLQTV